MKILSKFVFSLLLLISCASPSFIVVKKKNDKILVVRSFTDSIKANNFVQRKINLWQQRGYLLADYTYDASLRSFFLYKNEKFFFDTVRIKGLNERFFHSKQAADFDYLSKRLYRVVENYAQIGYPFARIKIDTFFLIGNKVKVFGDFFKGNYISFNKLSIRKKIVSDRFLAAYLKIKTGEPFNIKTVREVDNRLNALPFVSDVKKQVEFFNDKANIFIDFQKNNANSITALAGIYYKANKPTVVGQAELSLINIFKNAEQLNIKWKKTKNYSQQLDFRFEYPYIAGFQFGIGTHFFLFKQDTTFVNYNAEFLAEYFFYAMNKIMFSYLKNVGIALVEGKAGSFTKNLYGIGLKIERLDNPFIPRQGFSLFINTFAGYKHSDDSLFLQKKIIADFAIYQKVNKVCGVDKIKFGAVIGKPLVYNELIPIGGVNSLRGFNENEFFLKKFLIHTTEIGLFLSELSKFYIFYDFGYLIDIQKVSIAHAIGIGLNLKSKNNLLTLAIADGKLGKNPFLFSHTKLHIGFKTFF